MHLSIVCEEMGTCSSLRLKLIEFVLIYKKNPKKHTTENRMSEAHGVITTVNLSVTFRSHSQLPGEYPIVGSRCMSLTTWYQATDTRTCTIPSIDCKNANKSFNGLLIRNPSEPGEYNNLMIVFVCYSRSIYGCSGSWVYRHYNDTESVWYFLLATSKCLKGRSSSLGGCRGGDQRHTVHIMRWISWLVWSSWYAHLDKEKFTVSLYM